VTNHIYIELGALLSDKFDGPVDKPVDVQRKDWLKKLFIQVGQQVQKSESTRMKLKQKKKKKKKKRLNVAK
jgi:hypothetical protein